MAEADRLKKNLLISDVVSSDGNGDQLQWVDLVLAGECTASCCCSAPALRDWH